MLSFVIINGLYLKNSLMVMLNSTSDSPFICIRVCHVSFILLKCVRLTYIIKRLLTYLLLLYPFNGLFSRTSGVGRHQKGNHSGFYWSKR